MSDINAIIRMHPHQSLPVLAGMYEGTAVQCEINHRNNEFLPDDMPRTWLDRANEARWIAQELRKRF